MTDRNSRLCLYLSSFFIPILLLIAVFALHGIFPFGDKTVMTGDMEYQFVDYLAYLKTIVFGNNDFAYSFSKNLGGSMAGFSAYYYFSPLNLITLFFPNTLLPVAESVVIVLTVALSSLAMAVLLAEKYDGNAFSALFAVAYGMSGFAATYFQLTMYSGNLILFPLIILGLLRLMEGEGKGLFYIVTLAAAVLFNYYSGYMICIFSLLFFIAESAKRGFEARVFKRFIMCSALAVALTAFNLVPAVLSLRGEKNSFSFELFRTFSIKDFPAQFFTGAFNGNVSTGLPNVFCGVAVLFFFLLYLMDKEIALKTRLVMFFLWLFLILNFQINLLNTVWHGFNQPIGFPYRYSYMLSFVMILAGHSAFIRKGAALGKRQWLYPAGIIFLMAAWTALFTHDAVSRKELVLDLILLLFSLAALMYVQRSGSIIGRENGKRLALVLLTAAGLFDLTYNYYDAMSHYSLASLEEYRSFIEDVSGKLEVCDEDASDGGQGEELYRIEKYFRRTNNDAMQFNYAGLSHFSSSEKKDKINFMGKLGFRNNGNWSFYNESTTSFLESFFGVRYILSQYSSTPNKYEKLLKDEEISIFKNENALPLIFAATDGIRDINYNGYNGDPFMLQEAIADSLNGRSNELFEMAEVLSVETENLEHEDKDGYTEYKKKDADRDAWIDVRLRVKDEDRNLFAYFDADDNQNAELLKDGVTFGDYFSRYRWNIISFHRTKKKSDTVIRIRLIDDSLVLGNMYFYFEDRDKVKGLMSEIKESASSLRKLGSSHLIGNVTVPAGREAVTLTVPYDKGWSVYVDGEKAEIKRAAGILLSFDAAQGKHAVEMRYSPEGGLAGRLISAVAVLVLIFFVKFLKNNEKSC